MRTLLAAFAATTILAGAAQATTVYPLDRATILVARRSISRLSSTSRSSLKT